MAATVPEAATPTCHRCLGTCSIGPMYLCTGNCCSCLFGAEIQRKVPMSMPFLDLLTGLFCRTAIAWTTSILGKLCKGSSLQHGQLCNGTSSTTGSHFATINLQAHCTPRIAKECRAGLEWKAFAPLSDDALGKSNWQGQSIAFSSDHTANSSTTTP
jgi:hypothetical protein